MRWSLLSVAAAAAIGGCSADAPTDAANQDAANRDESPVASSRAADDTASSPAAPGMSAKVSSLTGTVSGLNTRVTDMGTIIDLPADAMFEYDKAVLTQAAEVELRKAAEMIRSGPSGAIRVIGHTDSKGDDAYNQTLSEARANSVADWLREQVGVRQRELLVSGRGEAAPIAPNENAAGDDDPAGRAKNRRVELVVPTTDGQSSASAG